MSATIGILVSLWVSHEGEEMIELWVWDTNRRQWLPVQNVPDSPHNRGHLFLTWLRLRHDGLCTAITKDVVGREPRDYFACKPNPFVPERISLSSKAFPVPMREGGYHA